MREKFEISAVRDRDLRDILDAFGLSEKIDNEELTCWSCSATLTWDNIGGFIVAKKGLRLFCSVSDCIEAAKKEESNG
jgi:hypothetical protein